MNLSDEEPNGATRIAAERMRQLRVKGWTPEHDDEHTHFELSGAAIAYIKAAAFPWIRMGEDTWPWSEDAWRASDDKIRNLVKAGALIAAEIDRLQRCDLTPWSTRRPPMLDLDAWVEPIARLFHDTYEELAPRYGWETQERSRKEWADVPPENKAVVLATTAEVVRRLVADGWRPPSPSDDEPRLGLATTRELLEELAVRMEVTQNSLKGRDLGRLCREALANLASFVLDYRPVDPYPETDPDEPVEEDSV